MVKDLDGKAVASKEEMFQKVNQIWDRYRNGSPTYWEKLSASMVNRLRLVIEADGSWTKY